MENPHSHHLDCFPTWLAAFPLLAAGLLFAAVAMTPVRGEFMAARGNPVTPVQMDTALRDAHQLASLRDDLDVVRVEGRSMLPFFGDGAVLVVKTTVAAQNLRPGMLVIYENHLGERVVHRVEDHDRNGNWVVRGWNNVQSDSTRVSDRNLIGVVYATFHAAPQVMVADAASLSLSTPVALAAPAK